MSVVAVDGLVPGARWGGEGQLVVLPPGPLPEGARVVAVLAVVPDPPRSADPRARAGAGPRGGVPVRTGPVPGTRRGPAGAVGGSRGGVGPGGVGRGGAGRSGVGEGGVAPGGLGVVGGVRVGGIRVGLLVPEGVPGGGTRPPVPGADRSGPAADGGAQVPGTVTLRLGEVEQSPEPADPPVAIGPGLLLDRGARQVLVDGEPLELTRREFDLLAHLAGRPGRVLTRHQLLTAAWGPADSGRAGPRTVDVHVARVRRKLGERYEAVVDTVRGVGYRWVPDPKVTRQ